MTRATRAFVKRLLDLDDAPAAIGAVAMQLRLVSLSSFAPRYPIRIFVASMPFFADHL